MVPDTALLSTIVVIGPGQIVCVDGVATALGIGLTVTFTFVTGPLQPLALGVMENVVTCGVLVVLVRVPDIGVPDPLAGIPVTFAVLLLVQLNVVPATGPVRLIGVIAEPEQIVCGATFDPQPAILGTVSVPTLAQLAPLNVPRIHPEATILPSHLTSHKSELSLKKPCASIKKVNGPPVAGTTADPVNGGFCTYGPPLSTTTLAALVSVQEISSAKPPSPWMNTCMPPVLTVGVGFTSTVALIGAPAQPFALGVIVKVTVTGAFVVLVSVPLILPVPLAAIPVTVPVLFLVQL